LKDILKKRDLDYNERTLNHKGFEKKVIIVIFKFIDWRIALPKGNFI